MGKNKGKVQHTNVWSWVSLETHYRSSPTALALPPKPGSAPSLKCLGTGQVDELGRGALSCDLSAVVSGVQGAVWGCILSLLLPQATVLLQLILAF